MSERSLSLIEAAGEVGEARLVARQLRTWIDGGVPAADVVVAARDLAAKEPLLREVFDEYAVPAAFAIPEPVARCGAVVVLLRAWSLARRRFPFRDVAALWRNNYFRPIAFDPELPLKAESLLRQLNVPRGRDSYLAVAQVWASEKPPAPLEDESKEKTRREERSQLAKRCLGYYQWFFALWDTIPPQAPPRVFANELRRLAKELGLLKPPLPGAQDAVAMTAFGQALDALAENEAPVSQEDFARSLADLAAVTAWPKPEINGVRVLPASLAAEAECSHLLLLGLSEGSFPQLGDVAAEKFDEKLAQEKTLFEKLITRPTRALVLSYPAIDEKGQAQLPASLLGDLIARMPDISRTKQMMLLDGYLTSPPVSDAEKRVQNPSLPEAKRMANARFWSSGANNYCGVLTHPPLVAAIAAEFGPDYRFSPTSLENYVGCPFRFWLEKGLGVQELESPVEEVEATRRGSALHRALSRFHQAKPHERPDSLAGELETHWAGTVAESVDRTPSPAGQVLWRLEQRRLQRALNRYPGHWSLFRDAWKPHKLDPLPHKFEQEFDCVLEIDGVRVRLGGTIDRVDVAKLDDGFGFWIVDYKSGGRYSAGDVTAFERLQLPLYAIGVERLPSASRNLRPLGLAYWLIAKEGPRPMLPEKKQAYAWLADAQAWRTYRADLERVVAKLIASLRGGDFRLAPRRKDTCEYCPGATVCRINQQRGRLQPLELIGAGE